MPRHFLRDDDLTPAEQTEVLDLAAALKMDRYGHTTLAGPRTVAILFDKPTLRTQLSFTTAVAELAGFPMVVDGRLAQVGERESIADTARVLGRQVAAIVWRTYGQDRIEEMAEYAGVPVVNALTDSYHPCQLLADLQTIRERKGNLAGLSLGYLGDGANNMAHSYALAGALAGMHIRIGSPEGYDPDPAIMTRAKGIAADTGGSVTHHRSVESTVDGVDVLATDTWVSMGQERSEDRLTALQPYSLDEKALQQADSGAIVLHCLPAYRGKEIAAEVIDGPASRVWDEAENRLHAQKALLHWLLERS
jgi:ornithine carbamoyltransferase